MVCTAAFRRKQKEDSVYGFVVNGVKVNGCLEPGKNSANLVQFRQASVRESRSAAKTG